MMMMTSGVGVMRVGQFSWRHKGGGDSRVAFVRTVPPLIQSSEFGAERGAQSLRDGTDGRTTVICPCGAIKRVKKA